MQVRISTLLTNSLCANKRGQKLVYFLKMSQRTMPLLFINMGGEMVYILDQRLSAQSVNAEKSVRVMADIIGTMFSKKFMDEIFKPQPLYSRRGMRALFEKLAHASIMRLNQTSMDKLYDLMTMACKYQLLNVVSPKDVLLITLNHMDGMRKLVQGQAPIQALIDSAYQLLSITYLEMNGIQLHQLRSTMLTFYQDARVKVSMLLREKKQKEDGRFVISVKGGKAPFGGSIPGTIRYYIKGEQTSKATFNSGGSYSETVAEGSMDKVCKKGERVIEYGTNMYKNLQSTETQGGIGSATLSADSQDVGTSKGKSDGLNQELSLLAKLLRPESNAKSDFVLSLFENESEESQFVTQNEQAAKEQQEMNVVKIDASKRDTHELNKLVGDMDVKDKKKKKKAKGDELLELMDSMDS